MPQFWMMRYPDYPLDKHCLDKIGRSLVWAHRRRRAWHALCSFATLLSRYVTK